MSPRLLLAAVLAFSFAARAQESEEERKRERETHERGEREYREKAEKGEPRPGDDEAFYAMGALLGSRVAPYSLTAKETEKVKRGFADAAAGKKLKLRDPDLEEWGPKVEAMLQRRGSPRITAEKEKGAKRADAEAKEKGAQKLATGVVVRTLQPAEGPSPAASDRVKVKYEGRLLDGKVFDSTEGTEFPLNRVIGCWTEGVQKMHVGEKARLVCPSSTAYGDQGRPPQIPGGATLVFDVELLSIGK